MDTIEYQEEFPKEKDSATEATLYQPHPNAEVARVPLGCTFANDYWLPLIQYRNYYWLG